MKYLIMLITAVLLMGCASLHEIAFNKIHKGDGTGYVQQVLGTPDSFQPLGKRLTAWFYKKGEDVCAVGIKDHKVTGIVCMKDKNYKNAAARFFQGFNSSMQKNKKIHCTSSTVGYMVNTNCN